MSNGLKKKAKKMEPAGYSKIELVKMRDNAKARSNKAELVEEVFRNVGLITYQIMHDKYGFGLKRIIRLENTINTYLENMSSGELTIDSLDFYMSETAKINVKDEANQVPFNERFALTHFKVGANMKPTVGMYILDTIYHYYVLLGVCLKSQFEFSPAKIMDVYKWIRYFMNTLSRPKQFDLTMKDIAELLMEEVKYVDERFIAIEKEEK